ncbi:MAG: prepilin peptidase [Bacteroidota bacterium]
MDLKLITSLSLVVWAGGLAYEDWRWRRLPNGLLLGGVAFGALHCLAVGATPFGAAPAEAGLAALLGLLAFLPFYALGWMGAGDVKLLAVIGCLGGLQILLVVVLLGSLLAGFLALLILLPPCQSLMSDASLAPRLRARLPFGAGLAMVVVALATGALSADFLPLSWSSFSHV